MEKLAKRWTQEEDDKLMEALGKEYKAGKNKTEAMEAAAEVVGRSASACNSRFKQIQTQEKTMVGIVMNLQMQNMELARELGNVKKQMEIFMAKPPQEKRKIGFDVSY
jgi:hypothetical protein